MDRKQFTEILIECRDALLRELAGKGPGPGCRFRGGEQPSAWDVNNGLCEDFAALVIARAPDAQEYPCERYLLAHVCLQWRGRWYDAECVQGAKRLRDLPIFRANQIPEGLRRRRTRRKVKS